MIVFASRSLPRIFTACFAVYGLVGTGFLALTLPPFQGPDEPAHFYRAEQLAEGQLIGERFGVRQSGGKIDRAASEAVRPFLGIIRHPAEKATPAMLDAGSIPWSGRREWTDFANTAIYPPFFYLPAALALRIAKPARLSVTQGIYLARLLGAITAVTIACIAICNSGAAAPWIFLVLSLPMSLQQMSTITQDGLLIAFSALAAALLSAARQRDKPASMLGLAAISASLAVVCMAHPPYLPLAALLWVLPGVRIRHKTAASTSIIGLMLLWLALASWLVFVDAHPEPTFNAIGQLRWVLAHPGHSLWVLLHSMAAEAPAVLVQFIGVLGWADTPLPFAYYVVTGLMLLISAAASTRQMVADQVVIETPLLRLTSLFIIVSALVFSVVLVFFSQYVTWTTVGADLVGVQGRYFTPIALFAVMVFSNVTLRRRNFGQNVLAATIVIFPIVSIPVMVHAVAARYYP